MKLTLLLLGITALAAADSHYAPDCPAPTTVTVTKTVYPSKPAYNTYGDAKPITKKPRPGSWGYNRPPAYPKPESDIPPTTVCTKTKYAGPSSPPTYEQETVTNPSTVSAGETLYYPPPAETHTVIVGGKDNDGKPILKFEPEVVWAKVGDAVIYDFRALNHSLTESSFENPCEAKAGGGFKSGFLPNKDNVKGKNLFRVYVEDEKPHWAYCGQKNPINHCQKGMVHAINPPLKGPRTFEAFKKKAVKSATNPIPPVSAPGKTIVVNVGGGKRGLNYVARDTGKPYVNAQPGDTIRFVMGSKKHSVTRSSFDTPCSANQVEKFATGPIENPDDKMGKEFVKEFVVPEGEKPIWFYCGVADHCQKGMVFAINPGNKFPEFLEKAKATPPKTDSKTSTKAAPTESGVYSIQTVNPSAVYAPVVDAMPTKEATPYY